MYKFSLYRYPSLKFNVVFVVGWDLLVENFLFFFIFLYLLWERGVCLQNVPKPVGGGK